MIYWCERCGLNFWKEFKVIPRTYHMSPADIFREVTCEQISSIRDGHKWIDIEEEKPATDCDGWYLDSEIQIFENKVVGLICKDCGVRGFRERFMDQGRVVGSIFSIWMSTETCSTRRMRKALE